jgi:hypothetical protein
MSGCPLVSVPVGAGTGGVLTGEGGTTCPSTFDVCVADVGSIVAESVLFAVSTTATHLPTSLDCRV